VSDPQPSSAPDRVPLGELGGYQLLERIGAGALGEVFRARDTVHGRTVLIKRVPAALTADEDRISQLRDAAMALAAVSHPGVAMVYECGDDDGQSFLAQEFVPGQTLSGLIGGRPLNVAHAVDMAIRMGDALGALHAAGLTHGDLRPDNIVVTPKGHVKLLDAGLSAFTGGGAARASAGSGARSAASRAVARYLAPEEALGEHGDRRADIFALGLVLHEMLTGRPAFDHGSADDTLLDVLRTTPPPPSAVNAKVPAELDAILAKALAKAVDARYQTAVEFADALRRVKSRLDDDLDDALPPEQERNTRVWLWVAAAAAGGAAAVWYALSR
jgi:eukaryotic-like serine/threonine-protein kinase